MGALKAHLQPDTSHSTFWAAIAGAVVGLLVVVFAHSIAGGIHGFMAGNLAGEPPVIAYRFAGVAVFVAMIVFAMVHRFFPKTDLQVRHEGLRITTGSRKVELRWAQIHDITICESVDVYGRSMVVFRNREITIQHGGEPIVIAGIQEHEWPITDILMHEWERAAGH